MKDDTNDQDEYIFDFLKIDYCTEEDPLGVTFIRQSKCLINESNEIIKKYDLYRE